MCLVTIAQAFENLDGIRLGRRLDRDRLEPACECRILFDVFAIFIERRRADALNFAARIKGRLPGTHCLHRWHLPAPPAPTNVCSSSINRMTFFARRTSFITALMRSSNWPRYFVPATIIARSSTTMRRSCRISGTLFEITIWARPSTMAVLPTPASPKSTGLFFCRRQRI